MNEWNAGDWPAAITNGGWRPVVLQGYRDDPDDRVNYVVPSGETAQLSWLQGLFGGWHVWYVPCFDGNRAYLTWCARRHSDGKLLNADSAGHLAEDIGNSSLPDGVA